MKKAFTLFLLFTLIVCGYCGAVTVTMGTADLWQLFPKDTQGENGIRLQYRSGAGYTDLLNFGDYSWKTSGTSWNLPYVVKVTTIPGRISTHPSAVTQIGYDRDPLIRVQLASALTRVRVTGSAANDSWGDVRFYIFKGADGFGSPIWQQTLSNNSIAFDLTIDFISGEELFFAADSGNADYNDWGRWNDIKLTGIPEPMTLALLGLGSLIFVRKQK